MNDDRDDGDWRESIRDRGTWLRGLHMLLLLLCLSLALMILYAVAAVQFASVLFTRRPFEPPLPFARSLSAYIAGIALFLTWTSDIKPWPWSPWPDTEVPASDDWSHGGGANGVEEPFEPEQQEDEGFDDTDRPEEEPPPSERLDNGSDGYTYVPPPRPDA